MPSNSYEFYCNEPTTIGNAVVIIDYITGTVTNDFSIAAYARHSGSNRLLGKITNDTSPELSIVKQTSEGDIVLNSVPVNGLMADRPYWIVLISADEVVRCEHWDTDPRDGGPPVATVSYVLSDTDDLFNVESEVGVTDWVPAASDAAIAKLESGFAFVNNESVMSTVLEQRHVDIRDFINYRYPVRYRTIGELNEFKLTESAFSQTITMTEPITGGTFLLRFYPADADPYIPIFIDVLDTSVSPPTRRPFAYDEDSELIRAEINRALNNLPKFSNSFAEPIKSVRNNLSSEAADMMIEFDENFGNISLFEMVLTGLTPEVEALELFDPDTGVGMFSPTTFEDELIYTKFIETADPLNKSATLDELRLEYRFKNENWRMYSSGLQAPSTRNFRPGDLVVGKLAEKQNRRGLSLNFSRAMKRKNKTSLWEVFLQSSTTPVNCLSQAYPYNVHDQVVAATATELAYEPTYDKGRLTATSNGLLVIDGINALPGTRFLVKNQPNARHNGIYNVTAPGSESSKYILTRAEDYNGSEPRQISPGDYVYVIAGEQQGNKTFIMESVGGYNDDRSIVLDLEDIFWSEGALSINMKFVDYPWDPATGQSVIDLNANGCYIQFTSQRNGLFADQGGEEGLDSREVRFKDHMLSLDPTSPNVEFKAFVSEFLTSKEFSFSSVTGVRIYVKENIGSTVSRLKITSIRCVDNSPIGGKRWLSAEINTLEQTVSPPDLDYTGQEVALPPMIGGEELGTIQSDVSPIDSRQALIFQNGKGGFGTNRMMLFAREQELDDLQRSMWLTAEYRFSNTDAVIKRFKTLRVRSGETLWDIHPGGIFEDAHDETEVPVTIIPSEFPDNPLIGDHVYRSSTNEFYQWSGVEWVSAVDPNEKHIGDLELLNPETNYEFSATFQSNFIDVEINELTSAEQPLGTIYNSPNISSAEWSPMMGRIGWYVEFADQDVYISAFDLESAAYAVLRTKQFESESSVEGAQLFTVDSGYRNLFERFYPLNSSDFVVIDNQKTASQRGSWAFQSRGTSTSPGLISNEFFVSDWNHLYIEFDIWVPKRLQTDALRPKILLRPVEQPAGTSGNDVFSGVVPSYAPISFDFVPGAWSKFTLDLRGVNAKNGSYYLVILSDGDGSAEASRHADRWWIDNVKINTQTIEWEVRAIESGSWVPFRRNVNEQYGGLHLPYDLRGKNLQLQAKALTEDAWVAEYTLIPKYVEPGLIVRNLNTSVVRGVGETFQRERYLNANVLSSSSTMAIGNEWAAGSAVIPIGES